MITNNQTRRLLRAAALSAVLLLMAAPAALADPQGYELPNPRPVASVLGNTPSSVELSNAPKPDACWLSSSKAFADIAARRPPSNTPTMPTAGYAGGGGANLRN